MIPHTLPAHVRDAVELEYDAIAAHYARTSAGFAMPPLASLARSFEVIARRKGSTTTETIAWLPTLERAKMTGGTTLSRLGGIYDRIEIERNGVVVASMGAE